MFSFGNQGIEEILPAELNDKIEAGSDVFILDVREPFEFEQLRMSDSTLIPLNSLGANETHLSEQCKKLAAARASEVVVICRSGVRSLSGASVLKRMGFENVKSLKTGVVGWAMAGFPTEGLAGRQMTQPLNQQGEQNRYSLF